MLATSLPLILTLSLVQNASTLEMTDCEEIQRIELSRTALAPHEVCVSPGLMTGFFFDATVSVELQDELRFEEVSRGRTSISVLPPRDMAPGERLRFSARYVDGHTRDAVTLTLVAASGQATRQVEVFRDTRTRESFESELKQERAKNQHSLREMERLRFEFDQFRQQYGDTRQLRWLISSGSMTREGIRAKAFMGPRVEYRGNDLLVEKGVTYRSGNRAAIEIWLVNSSPTPWRPIDADLRDAHNLQLETVYLWQKGPSVVDVAFMVIIEVGAASDRQLGECSLVLRDDIGRDIAIKGIEMP
jgi:uncharacterized protein (TIGR02268 family)